MIPKNNLKGRYVQFIDRNGATRICKVYRVTGKTLTVGTVKQRHCLHWERIHPEKNTIHGVIVRKKLVDIDWS